MTMISVQVNEIFKYLHADEEVCVNFMLIIFLAFVSQIFFSGFVFWFGLKLLIFSLTKMYYILKLSDIIPKTEA